MPNAVIYARYSSHGQNEQSIDGQIEECMQYCEQMNFNVLHVYHDDAISGRSDAKRDEFLKMIDDSKKELFEYVVVWKLDRFARNRFDSAIYKRELKRHGVRVLSAKQNISISNEGVFYEAILEANDEYFSLNLSTNVRRGQRQSAEKGLFLGGHCLFGYRVNKTISGSHTISKVEIDEKTAPIVRFIFEEYASGTPKKKIVDKLNARGYRNASGKPFTINGFQDALRNPRYTGTYYYGSEKIKCNGYPPLISQELFDKVQMRLAEKRRAPARAKAKVQYLLTGKAYCGHCGAAVVGTSGTSKAGGTHHYYNCSTRYKKHTCTKSAEKKDFLEWYVTEQTMQYVLQPKRLNFIAERLVEEYKKQNSQTEIRSLDSRIADIEAKINQAADAFIEADSDMRKTLNQKVKDLTTLKNGLIQKSMQLKALNKAKYTKQDIIKQIEQFCNGDPLDPDFQTRIIDGIVNCVYIEDNRITIYYNVDGGKQVSLIENADITQNIGVKGEIAPMDSGAGVFVFDKACPAKHVKD